MKKASKYRDKYYRMRWAMLDSAPYIWVSDTGFGIEKQSYELDCDNFPIQVAGCHLRGDSL